MAAHARLKNEFTEDEKCHSLMRLLKFGFLLLLKSCKNAVPGFWNDFGMLAMICQLLRVSNEQEQKFVFFSFC